MKLRLLVCLLVVFSGCWDDKKAALYGPWNPLPPGATYSVSLGDSCVSGELGCQQESVDETLLFESDHPKVVELVDANTLLPTTTLSPSMAVHAVAIGSATIRARGKFSDGSEREATLGVSVRNITTVRLDEVCGVGSTSPYYLPCGSKIDFQVLMYTGDQPMQGHLPSLISGVDLTPLAQGDLNYFEWAPTTCPEQVIVTSNFDPGLREVFSTFGPTDVTSVKLDYPSELPTYLYQPGTIRVGVEPSIGNHATCAGIAPAAKTSTPAVCTGPNGELEWAPSDSSYLDVAIVREGTCNLTVGMAGGSWLAPFAVDAFLVRAPKDEPRVSVGDDCYAEGQVICDTNRTMTLVCSKRRWERRAACAAKQICDYQPAGSAGCTGAADCPVCRSLANP